MKRFISLLISIMLCLNFSSVAFAEIASIPEDDTVIADIASDEAIRAEETKWYYRITEDCLFQKRLWSITYRKWLTDWITIGYVNPNP